MDKPSSFARVDPVTDSVKCLLFIPKLSKLMLSKKEKSENLGGTAESASSHRFCGVSRLF